MSQIRRICVYCGSGPGSDPAFALAAQELGAILAANRIGLVYGGGSVGLMGALATAVLDAVADDHEIAFADDRLMMRIVKNIATAATTSA